MDSAKKVGLWDIVLYGTAMNFGIRWLATGAKTGPVAIPIWIAAAVLFLIPLVMATTALSKHFPEEGAIYAWTRKTQGPFAGFMCGWLYWACNLPYFAGLLIFIVSLLAPVIGGDLGHWIAQPLGTFALSSLIVLAVSVMHAAGIGVGKWVPIIGAVASFIILSFLVWAGITLSARFGSATNFATAQYLPKLDANGAILWSTMVFAYGGAEGVALLRNQAKGGAPQIARALVLIGVFLALAYTLGTAGMLMILPQDQASRLAGLPDAMQVALQKLKAPALQPWLLIGLASTMLGGLSAWFGAAARLPFAAGLDKSMPAVLAKLDPKTGAPTTAIWGQAVLVIALLALSQAGATVAAAYDYINAMSVLSYTLPYLFLFVAWLIIGGSWKAMLGFAVALSAILCSLVPSPDAADGIMATVKLAIAAGVMIGAGVIVYVIGLLRKTPEETA